MLVYKALVCGVLGLAKPDSTLQIIVGLLMVLAYLLLVLHYRPYEEEGDYRLAVLCQLALFCTLLAGLFLRIEARIEKSFLAAEHTC